MKACFMGLGYIGLPTAIIAAKHGVEIVGVDINPAVVEMTNQGKLHIIEPGMEEMLQDVVKSGMLKPVMHISSWFPHRSKVIMNLTSLTLNLLPEWLFPSLKKETCM